MRNHNLKISFLATTILLTTYSNSFAQSATPSFKLDEQSQKFSIIAKLPNEGTLMVHFKRITDWKSKEELQRITRMAIEQYQNLQDSFKLPLAQKDLFLKLPVNEELMAIQYQEKKDSAHQMIYKNGEYFSLKSTYDTLRVIKDLEITDKIRKGEDSSDYKRQIEYIFVLKDLNHIYELKSSEAIEHIGNQVDSVKNKYLKKWTYPETVDKSLAIRIDSSTKVENKSSFLKNLTPNYGFGIELFNGKLATTIDLGWFYVWDKYQKESGFLGLNINTYTFPQMDYKESSIYYSFNMEFGIANTTTGFLNNKSAIGIGYFVANFGATNNKYNLSNMTRMYLSFPLSSNLTLSLDMMTNWKISQKAIDEGKAKAVWGLSIKYMFL